MSSQAGTTSWGESSRLSSYEGHAGRVLDWRRFVPCMGFRQLPLPTFSLIAAFITRPPLSRDVHFVDAPSAPSEGLTKWTFGWKSGIALHFYFIYVEHSLHHY